MRPALGYEGVESIWPSNPIGGGKFLDQLNNHQLLKDYAPWS